MTNDAVAAIDALAETRPFSPDEDLDDWAGEYFESHRGYYVDILRRLPDPECVDRVLEVGSIPCHLTFGMDALGYDVVGLDIDPKRFDTFIAEHGLDIRQCDIERNEFPFPDVTFDFVLFSEVFEHLRVDPIHTLEEIERVLVPGGTLLLTTPNLYFIGHVYRYLRGNAYDEPYHEFAKLRTLGHMGHVREYSTDQVETFLRNTGFEPVDVDYANWHWDGSHRGLSGDIGRCVSSLIPSVRRFQIIEAKTTV
ncbi:class I SAM-dependent methyltransferase [Halosimplex sp. TS25]|uniref:class I SAM-dependent methyltransferase n=1 Tax=Halosimplex rarum TaxID=3396619 RepID=UPI0039EAF386